VRALAVCNVLAQLASQTTEDEFSDRIGTLMCLERCWSVGPGGASEDELTDITRTSLEIENISLQSILSHDSLVESQPVLVLCNNNTAINKDINTLQPTKHFSLLPSLLTVPFTESGELITMHGV